ncbi:MAG: PAS domain-containing protein, partial [Methanobacterium sp.]
MIKDIQSLEYFFGVSKEELIGKKYYDIFPKSHDPLFEKKLEEAIEEKKLFRFEVYHELEGRENWFLITINPSEDGMSIR